MRERVVVDNGQMAHETVSSSVQNTSRDKSEEKSMED